MKVTVIWILFLALIFSIHSIEARYRSGGSRGGSRGSGSRGSGSGSGSRGGGYGGSRPSPPIYHPPVRIPTPPVYKPPIQSSPPVYKPPVYSPPPPSHKPFPPIPPPISHPPVSLPGAKPSVPVPGSTSPKDSSSIFINNEGGGRPRPVPGNSYPDWANPAAKPSPPLGSSPGSHTPFPSSPPNSKPYPDWANPAAKPSPSLGSSPGSHTPFPPSPSNPKPYPDWANPAAKPSPPLGSSPGSHTPFPPSPSNPKPYPDWANPGAKPSVPIGSPGVGNPYPGSSAPRPYPPVIAHGQNTHAKNSSFPSLSSPYPAPKPNLPYPTGHPNMPQPNSPHIGFNPGVTSGVGSPQLAPPHHSAPLGAPPHLQSGYPGGYPSGGYSGGYHPMGQPGGLSSSYPTGHAGMVHNPYPMGHPGMVPSHYPMSPSGMPTYGSPHIYGGPAMSQPYIPGQTIILPSQSSSPGIGQLVKEALVYSTINAGVNRLINGAPHHHWGSSSPIGLPAGSSSVTNNTTTIIYNSYGPDQGHGTPGVPPGVPGTYGTSTLGGYALGNPGGSYGSGSPGGGYASGSPGGGYATGSSGGGYASGIPGGGYAPGSSGVYAPSAGSFGPATSSGGLPNPSSIPGNVPPVPAGGVHPVGGTPTAAPGSLSPSTPSSGTVNGGQSVTPAPEVPPAPQYYVPDDELMRLTETLFSKEEINLKKYVTLYVQGKVKDGNVTDEAPGPLMYTSPELEDMPTVRMLKNMFDNYQVNSTLKENSTSEMRKEENFLLDGFLNTDVMTTAMSWLAKKYYIEPDDFEMKDSLRHIWFNKIDGATSGFERIFLAELYPGPIFIGAQNWIYFAAKEASKEINYMGYSEQRAIADKATLMKFNLKMGDAVKQNVTMLVGTSPELEMALYTVCFYTRPNDICPVSLGGTQFYIYTHSFRYFGRDLIDVGIVAF